MAVEFRSDTNPFLKDKPKEKRGLKTSQKERRERRITKDRAKRPPKKRQRADRRAHRAAVRAKNRNSIGRRRASAFPKRRTR